MTELAIYAYLFHQSNLLPFPPSPLHECPSHSPWLPVLHFKPPSSPSSRLLGPLHYQKPLQGHILYPIRNLFGGHFYRAYVIMKRNCSQLRVRNLSSDSLFFFLQNPWHQQHWMESMEDLSGFSFSVSFPNGFILESKVHLLNSELPKDEKKMLFFFQHVRDFSNAFFVFKLLKSSFVWKFQTWHLWYITLSKECMLCLVWRNLVLK